MIFAPKARDSFLTAVVASTIAALIGTEIIAIIGLVAWVIANATSDESGGVTIWLLMLFVGPFFAALWVVPIGTIGAMLLGPVASKHIGTKTIMDALSLILLGAGVGFAGVFVAIYFIFGTVDEALIWSQFHGTIYGGSTAFGWFWAQRRTIIKSESFGSYA